ncbi:MAG: NAD-dependent epimerase/dehydratase family protein [Candidatus Zixiibacteriota bacterium]
MQGGIKTILVTGANGFIGSRVCRLLAASGYVIRIICRESSDLTFLDDIPYSKFVADITNPDSLIPAVTGADYIVHLAGLVKAKKRDAYFQINQQGTLNLLNAVRNQNINLTRFILISSTAAFGPSSGNPRREEDPPRPVTIYGQSKLAAEESARPFFNLFPITILRPPGVYGPGDKAIFPLFDIVNKGIRPYMAGGKNRIQMIYVDDLAKAIKRAVETNTISGQAYIIADNQAHTIREMLDEIGTLLNKKGIGISIPLTFLKGMALFSELLFRALGQAPHFSREKVKELTADWEFDVSKAMGELGFEAQTNFTQGARLAIEWYRKKGWLK